MNNIGAFLVIALIITSIIAMPSILNKNCNEDCFRKKYNVKETIATFDGYEMRGRTSTSKYVFIVDNVKYFLNATPISDSELEGDKFVVLYDSINPDNSLLLRNQPVIPDSLIKMDALIKYVDEDADTKSVIIIFEYTIEKAKIKRLQYIPIQYLELIKKNYNLKSMVKIDVYVNNARRSFLDVNSL